ncbi:hypothetical protein [Pseudomonas sp. S1(2024)]|uniref:hypothetical protein n=1 Tax=Pseudomonas sp. S1(2024) TaxID=3390191 RepID=UPI00397D121D
MWDIIAYVDSEISLLLKQRDIYYIFKYPWKEPKAIPALLTTPRPEAINVQTDKLLGELVVRSRLTALEHVCNLTRGALKGMPAGSERELVTEALKFALRRKKMDLIQASEFIRMLTSCALLTVIPDSFWNACASEMDGDTLNKLRASLNTLEVLHPRNDDWLNQASEFLARVAWSQNQFLMIETTCRQLSYLHSKLPVGEVFAELRKKSTSMIQREAIERDMLNQKPWQKNAVPTKKSIKIGPYSKSRPDRPADSTNKKNAETDE